MHRVLRHRSEHGRWTLVLGTPAAQLRTHVYEYQGYAERTAHPIRRREVPGGRIPLIINFGPPFRMLDPADPEVGETHDSFVAGLHNSYALVQSTGTAHCLQIDLTPIGAWRPLGLPMHELADRVVELDDVLGSSAPRLVESLHEAPDWPARFALLDDFFTERLAAARDVPRHRPARMRRLRTYAPKHPSR